MGRMRVCGTVAGGCQRRPRIGQGREEVLMPAEEAASAPLDEAVRDHDLSIL